MSPISAFCGLHGSPFANAPAFANMPVLNHPSAGFFGLQAKTNYISSSGRSPSFLRMAEENIDDLLAQAQKAREEAEAMERAMGREPKKAPVKEEKPKVPDIVYSFDEIMSSLGGDSGEGLDANQLDSLKSEGKLKLFNAEDPRYQSISIAALKDYAGIDSDSMDAGDKTDDLKWLLFGVTAASSLLGFLSLKFIGGNLGSTITYFVALIPVLVLGIGSTSPGLITALLQGSKSRMDSDFQDRRIVHEAAHFLIGYLCGLPVKTYEVREGMISSVEFYETQKESGDNSLSEKDIIRLSIVALAGSVGEIMKYKTAGGGSEDLTALQYAMLRANPPLPSNRQQGMTRFGAFESYNLLTKYQKQFDCLADAIREGKTINECIALVETTK